MYRNEVNIAGQILEEFSLAKEVFGKRFYTTKIAVKRLSGNKDIIPIVIPEEVRVSGVKNTYAKVSGEYRSFSQKDDEGKRHLNLFLYVYQIEFKESLEPEFESQNEIVLVGTIIKPPVFRYTPERKKITELFIAADKRMTCSYYIPCIAWNGVANYAKKLQVGDKVKIRGRIQSRKYIKRYENVEEEKTVQEVSVVYLLKAEN